MAVNPVSLAETLRPWHGAGIICLLRDPVWAEEADVLQAVTGSDESRQFLSQGEESGVSPASSPNPAEPLSRIAVAKDGSGQLQTPNTSQNAAAALEKPLPPTTQAMGSSSQQRSSFALRANETYPQENSPSLTPTSLDAREAVQGVSKKIDAPEMPESWKRLLERTQAAPLLWTYAELGSDLHAQGNSEESLMRSQVLRSLIGGLSLPKGSSCFWPITLSDDWAEALRQGQPVQDTVFFHLGLECITPKSIVLFGRHSAALAGLHADLRLPFTQQIAHKKLLVLLPSFADLQVSKAAQAKATAYLRSAFSNFPALFI